MKEEFTVTGRMTVTRIQDSDLEVRWWRACPARMLRKHHSDVWFLCMVLGRLKATGKMK